MTYQYVDTAGQKLSITECTDIPGGAHVHILGQNYRPVTICIPADERQAAAQALAGDDFRIIPITADDRPASHQEIAKAKAEALREAADAYSDYDGGDDERVVRLWLRKRADLIETPPEPEPDPAAVEAMYQAIYRTPEGQRQVRANQDGRADEYRAIAEGLVRAGVEVPSYE